MGCSTMGKGPPPPSIAAALRSVLRSVRAQCTSWCSFWNSDRTPNEIADSGATGGELLEEAGEIGDVDDRRSGRTVAVGVGVAGGELLEEAGEIGHVRGWGLSAPVAVD